MLVDQKPDLVRMSHCTLPGGAYLGALRSTFIVRSTFIIRSTFIVRRTFIIRSKFIFRSTWWPTYCKCTFYICSTCELSLMPAFLAVHCTLAECAGLKTSNSACMLFRTHLAKLPPAFVVHTYIPVDNSAHFALHLLKMMHLQCIH